MNFKIAIPARYASKRLPGKPLLHIAGRPMIHYVYRHAVESGAGDVIIASDDVRVAKVAEEFGARVCMTSKDHESGSDRIAEAALALGWDDDTIIVNLQSDEPMMPPANIRQVAHSLHGHAQASIATLCGLIHEVEEFNDPNVVKVVRDENNFALYFSRAPIPWDRDKSKWAIDVRRYRHIGIYAYRLRYLRTYLNTPRCEIEALERLEQLRALWRGDKIYVEEALESPGHGVDTRDDLEAVETLMAETARHEQT